MSTKEIEVLQIYTGKQGCRCGCQGNYRSQVKHAEAAGTERGYALSADEISDRAVTMAVNKMNAMLAGEIEAEISWDSEGRWVDAEFGNERALTIYFLEPVDVSDVPKHQIAR